MKRAMNLLKSLVKRKIKKAIKYYEKDSLC